MKLPKYFGLFTILILFLYSCRPIPQDRQSVVKENGMVSSAHPLASQVGVDIMQKGGNAYDAAVAVHFALAVCYPRAGNIGGGGFAVVRTSAGEVHSIDFREKAPAKAGRDMYLDAEGNVIKDLSIKGRLASGVPGSVDGILALHDKFGSMPVKELIAPAIKMAEDGFALTEAEAEIFNKFKEVVIEESKFTPQLFSKEGTYVKGDIILQPNLAKVLHRIADNGRNGFYEGETARLIAADMEKHGGIITLEDLKNYHSVWRKPLTAAYKQYRIISMPPASSGGVALIQLMKGIEPYPIHKWGHNNARTLHIMTELQRRVYADRSVYMGDTDFFSVPLDSIISDEYLQWRFEGVSEDKKTASEDIKQGKVDRVESVETTHYSIVDKERNAVSITTTINSYFGSKVAVEGAEFMLNNEMDDFSAKPGVPNQFGLVGAEANAIQPHKRMLSSMTPTIVEKDGELYIVIGSPGGSTIITSVFQCILNVIEHDMDLQTAVNAPRFHHQWLPDLIIAEDKAQTYHTNAIKELENMGHTFQFRGAIGRVDAVRLLPNNTLEGAADPRGDDLAVGF